MFMNRSTQKMLLHTPLCNSHFTLYADGPPIPVAAQSEAWVCGRSLAGIAGSNPTGGMDVCLL